jgi:deoxyadenosine/deoxycytidine kinase
VSEHERRYMVVEGPIGVGKTTLARKLAQSLGGEALLERAEDNPFLERFYQDPRAAALPTQLHFLFQRSRQLTALRQGDLFRSVVVSDFMMEKDRLFAQVTLDEHEMRLYEQVYSHVAVRVPPPDLVIYLQAPVHVLQERIARRGITWEQNISVDYLERLADVYLQFFHRYEAAPLLIVNASEIDLAHSDQDYRLLLVQIDGLRGGRHYLNPQPWTMPWGG